MNDITIYSMAYLYILGIMIFFGIRILKIGHHRQYLIAFLRMTVQLTAAGFLLRFIFNLNTISVVMSVYFVMSVFASHTVISRVDVKIKNLFFKVFIPISASGILSLLFFQFFLSKTELWYEARYFIPLAGMFLGNAMNACAICIDRFISEIKNNTSKIETLITLGANPFESIRKQLRKSIYAASIPIITNMSGIGIVFLPGLMTGQILSGADPIDSVKYQISIMILILLSLTVASVSVLFLSYRDFFDKEGNIDKQILEQR